MFSAVRMRPSRGRTMCRRSGSRRIGPVLKWIRPCSFNRFLNRGKPILGPLRMPFLEPCQLPRAALRSASPEENASLETPGHQASPVWALTAVLFFSAFQRRRREGTFQDT